MKNFIAKVLATLGVIGLTACQTHAQLIGGYPATNTVSTNSWWLVSDWAVSSNTVAGNRRIDLVNLRALMQQGVGAGTTWGNTNEVWLAPRTDAIAGSGTFNDPLDASTRAKFDTIMTNLQANTTIHLQSGTYQTYGANGWLLKGGQRLIGAGISNTVIRAVGGATRTNYYVIDGQQDANAWKYVSDLTVDCDVQGNAITMGTINGVALLGNGSMVERVRVTDFGTMTDSVEAQGIAVGRGNVAIIDCLVDTDAAATGNTASAILVDGTSVNTRGWVLNNRVVFDTFEAGYYGLTAGGGTIDSCIFEGNYVERAASGFYGDTGTLVDNLIIRGNIFERCFYGVYPVRQTGGPNWANMRIENNMFTITNEAPGPAVLQFALVSGAKALTNVLVKGNFMLNEASGGTSYGISGTGITNASFVGNRLSGTLVNSVAGESYWGYDNTDLAGAYATDVPNLTSAMLGGWLSDETGTGGFVRSNLPSLTNPTFDYATNTYELLMGSTVITGLTADRAVFTTGIIPRLTTSGDSARLAASLSDETGDGGVVFSNAPTLNNVTITGGASISGTGSNTVDAIYVTNGVSFYMAALPLDSGTTNFVVSLASTNSVLDISAAADVHFMHATNLIAGVAASALVRVMNDGAGNITVSCNADWHANGFEFTLTNDTVAVVTIQSFGGTAQTNVYAARAWFD